MSWNCSAVWCWDWANDYRNEQNSTREEKLKGDRGMETFSKPQYKLKKIYTKNNSSNGERELANGIFLITLL